jgi:hypothetical protein
MAKILLGSVIYFALVFAVGMAFGPIRVLLLEPAVGPFFAMLIEVPFLVLGMIVAAHYAPRLARVPSKLSVLAFLGAVALCLQQLADYLVGSLIRNMSLEEQTAQWQTPAGWVYALSLVLFALMPLALHTWRMRKFARMHGWSFKLSSS